MMRIKDPKQRAAVETLFGVREIPEMPEMPMSAKAHFFILDTEFPVISAEIDLEPAPDNAPWRKYNGEALKVRTPYLVAYKDFCGVNYAVALADSQGHLHKDVLAWLDVPKWRE